MSWANEDFRTGLRTFPLRSNFESLIVPKASESVGLKNGRRMGWCARAPRGQGKVPHPSVAESYEQSPRYWSSRCITSYLGNLEYIPSWHFYFISYILRQQGPCMVLCYIITWQHIIVGLDIENHLHPSLVRSQQFHLGLTCQYLNLNTKLVDVIHSRAASIFSVHLEHLIWLLYFVHNKERLCLQQFAHQ